MDYDLSRSILYCILLLIHVTSDDANTHTNNTNTCMSLCTRYKDNEYLYNIQRQIVTAQKSHYPPGNHHASHV